MLDTQKLTLKPGEWHTVLLEVCGKQMVATLDGDVVVAGSHDGIDVDKTNIGLPVAGEGVSFKDLKIWEAGASGRSGGGAQGDFGQAGQGKVARRALFGSFPGMGLFILSLSIWSLSQGKDLRRA
ncbi:MAG: hypothetical protein QM767_28055 [Anaeromyxobacter sp.]